MIPLKDMEGVDEAEASVDAAAGADVLAFLSAVEVGEDFLVDSAAFLVEVGFSLLGALLLLSLGASDDLLLLADCVGAALLNLGASAVHFGEYMNGRDLVSI